jgi:hypothetical protein
VAPRWLTTPTGRRFFDFIRTDAAPTLDAFARATGNVVAGLGSILVAFRPLSDDFTSGMLDMSRGFREWAANLGDSDGFQRVRRLHPRERPAVRDFFSAIGQAMVALAQAAAPWGSVVLPILTDVAKVFATIADSPIGPSVPCLQPCFGATGHEPSADQYRDRWHTDVSDRLEG